MKAVYILTWKQGERWYGVDSSGFRVFGFAVFLNRDILNYLFELVFFHMDYIFAIFSDFV